MSALTPASAGVKSLSGIVSTLVVLAVSPSASIRTNLVASVLPFTIAAVSTTGKPSSNSVPVSSFL